MPERHFRRALLVLGHGVFLALLALAWKYALIRSTFGDTAFQVFQWISQPGWDIEAHRYTAILPQAAVKCMALFTADLESLLYTASLAHAAVGYAIFLLCAHVWKSREAATACAIAAVLCSRLAFYSPVLEANYLLCYPFLLIGFVERRWRMGSWPSMALAVGAVLLLVPLIVHPIGWMVMLFALVLLRALDRLPMRAFLLFIAIAAAWPVVSRWVFPPTAYEIGRYEAVSKGFLELGSFSQWDSLHFLHLHTFTATNTYLPALLVLIAVVAGWFALRKARIGLLTFGGAAAFLFVYLITCHTGDSAIMLDRAVLPVATIIALGAAAMLGAISAPRIRVLALVLLTSVLFLKFRDVSFASRPFLHQMERMNELIAEARTKGMHRAIVPCAELREQGLEAGWSFPVESLLRSAAHGPDSALVLFCDDNLPRTWQADAAHIEVLGMIWPLDRGGELYFRLDPGPFKPLR